MEKRKTFKVSILSWKNREKFFQRRRKGGMTKYEKGWWGEGEERGT